MRTYEALYIVRPDLKDDEIQTVANEVEALVVKNGGATVRKEIWGKRRLAYEVKGLNEGVYILYRFQTDVGVLPKLEEYIRLSEQIIRHLIVHFDEKTLRLEAEQLQRNEEAMRSRSGRAQQDDEDEDDEDEAPRRRRASSDD